MSGAAPSGLVGRVRHSAYWRTRHARERLQRWWLRQEHRRQLKAMARPKLLAAFAEVHPAATFVEIGANDGQHEDQLHELIGAHEWSGVMVEPVPYVFERLRANYGHLERVALENAAIGSVDGTTPFYFVREADAEERERLRLPPWYDTIGSFSREAVMRHERDIPDLAERLVTTEVPTLTFTSLLAKHGIEQPDLVLLDTEGHDWAILAAIDLDRHHPRVLALEHYHLSPAEAEAARELLTGHGYELLQEGFDTFAVDTAPADALSRRFRELRPAVPAAFRHAEAR